MALWNHYYLAHNLTDALQALSEAAGPARLIGGGTDLLLDIQQGRHEPVDTLVDVTSIPELTRLEVNEGRLFIGAAAPLNQIVASGLVFKHAQAVNEACSLIGGPQVRNTATLGGNVAHALPAGDGTISLCALDAQAEIASLEGRRTAAMSELYAGPGRSTLQPGREILVGFSIARGNPGEASAFKRVMRPQGVAIAILNMGAWIERQDGLLHRVRIAVGPAGPTPFRAHLTEQFLAGQPLNDEIIAAASQVLLGEVHFRTSPHRATAEYRRHIAGVLLRDTLSAAWERAAQTDVLSV